LIAGISAIASTCYLSGLQGFAFRFAQIPPCQIRLFILPSLPLVVSARFFSLKKGKNFLT